MKRIIILLLALSTINAKAHEPKFSMFAKKDSLKVARFSSAQKGCYWLVFSGISLIGVSAINQVKQSQSVPEVSNFVTVEQYNKANDKYINNQKVYKTSINATIAVTGISIIIAAGYFLESKLVENDKISLNLKSNQTGIGLCLNFK